jgi:hypothetical protein
MRIWIITAAAIFVLALMGFVHWGKSNLGAQRTATVLEQSASSTGESASSSVPLVNSAASSAWATYSNPYWHYIIQYPNEMGSPVILFYPGIYDSSSSTVSLGWPAGDDLEINITPIISSTEAMLNQIIGFQLHGTILVDGVTSTLAIDQFGNERVIVNSTPTAYYIGVTYSGNNAPVYKALPVGWQRIVETFRTSSLVN